jgi:hypothetical protein
VERSCAVSTNAYIDIVEEGSFSIIGKDAVLKSERAVNVVIDATSDTSAVGIGIGAVRGDGHVEQVGSCIFVIDAATAAFGIVATDRAVGQRQRAARVADASTVPIRRKGIDRIVVADGTVGDGECAAVRVLDAAPICVCAVVADRGIADRHLRTVENTPAAESVTAVDGDGAIGDGHGPNIANAAAGSCRAMTHNALVEGHRPEVEDVAAHRFGAVVGQLDAGECCRPHGIKDAAARVAAAIVTEAVANRHARDTHRNRTEDVENAIPNQDGIGFVDDGAAGARTRNGQIVRNVEIAIQCGIVVPDAQDVVCCIGLQEDRIRPRERIGFLDRGAQRADSVARRRLADAVEDRVRNIGDTLDVEIHRCRRACGQDGNRKRRQATPQRTRSANRIAHRPGRCSRRSGARVQRRTLHLQPLSALLTALRISSTVIAPS